MSDKKFSTNNSSSVSLDKNERFIGKSDNTLNFTHIKFNYMSDAPSKENGIIIQFSEDNLTWENGYQFSTKLIQTSLMYAGYEKVYVKGKMFRIVYINGGLPQTYFRLNTTLILAEDNTNDEEPDEQVVDIKNTNNFLFDVVLGKTDYEYISIFMDVNKDEIKIPIKAEKLRVKKDGNLEDSLTRTGARKIKISGIDGDWNRIVEIVDLRGRDASLETSQKFLRINSVEVSEVGTDYGTNKGDIFIENIESNQIVSIIQQEEAITNHLIYSIPVNKKGIITSIILHTNGEVDFKLYYIKHFTGQKPIKKLMKKMNILAGIFPIMDTYEMVYEKTDILIEIVNTKKKNNLSCSCNMKMIMI